MPSITYNGQSFAIDGRRIWILGASIQYARTPAAMWASRIAAAKQAGFNTIETACPWQVHEPRRGRFVFDGDANVRQFIELCGAAGMRVVLRAGPYIDSHFDAGGMPGWLVEMEEVRTREDNELFLEHVSRFFRKLLGELSDLQATNGGPILLVQSEHAWICSNEQQAEDYLNEVTRFIRESGITVPIINANDLWQESLGTIDTWQGYDDLLVHLRQLRTVQPQAPRLVSAFDPAVFETWGGRNRTKRPKSKEADALGKIIKTPDAVQRRLAEILASGAQPIVSPFHAGTNFGFLGGREAGGPDNFVTTSVALDAPLAEAGGRGAKYHAIRRLITFANHFGQVFAELEPDYQPIVLDPAMVSGKADARFAQQPNASVVPLRGPQGRVVFVFANEGGKGFSSMLVLDGGIRLPVHLGDQSVGWYALDVDLHGMGRLDYASVCPWAIIDRSIVVFQGPAKSQAFLSVGGTPLDMTVPAEGAKPLVLEHKGLTLVVCNQTQIDVTYHDEKAVYVGIGGFDADGTPMPAAGVDKAWVIRREGRIDALTFEQRSRSSSRGGGKRANHDLELRDWHAAPATEYVTGRSPRFASLEGPETLSECGAPLGYGWYRLRSSASGRVFCHAPRAADRVHLFIEGKLQTLFGVGVGAHAGPFELKIAKGEQTIVALVDNFGRFSDGNDLGQPKGLYGNIYEVKALKSAKPKVQAAEPVNPFILRGFIARRDATHVSDSQQLVWTFAHPKKTPVLVDVHDARISGTFVLNDEPIAYFAGATGACTARVLLDPKTTEALKRGKNVLRFAPDFRDEAGLQEFSRAATLYECLEPIVAENGWAFAKWEPPMGNAFVPTSKAEFKPAKGMPCWWRASFINSAEERHSDALPVWLEVTGLSKGQAFVNGQNLGRYFTATADGKPVGPQTRMYVPTCWLKAGHVNEVMIFDEHGFVPTKVRLVRSADEHVAE